MSRTAYVLSFALALSACGDDDAGDGGPDAEAADSSTDTNVGDTGGADVATGDDAGPENDAGDEDAGGDVGPTVDAGPPPEAEFQEVDGLVVFEAENYFEQVRDEWTRWYPFVADGPAPDVMCRTNVTCGDGNAPDCNQYGECDGDDVDPSEASNGTYLEALPDRRRDDSEPGTGGQIGVVNNPDMGPTLRYRVQFTTPGRYYVWIHARGQGPAANGLHVGIDDTWPRNELRDASSMRMQFANGWRWTQTRRGQNMHTGVSAGGGVSLRDANIWLEVDAAGVHTIQLGMREDGLEIDKIIMSTDPEFEPSGLEQPETTL